MRSAACRRVRGQRLLCLQPHPALDAEEGRGWGSGRVDDTGGRNYVKKGVYVGLAWVLGNYLTFSISPCLAAARPCVRQLMPLKCGPGREHLLAGGALVQPGGEVGVLEVDLHGGAGGERLWADRTRHFARRKLKKYISVATDVQDAQELLPY